MKMAKPGIKVEAPNNNNKEETQSNQVDEESIIKLTCRLITAIDKKINYKLLFFLSLSIIIGFYINQSDQKKKSFSNENLIKDKNDQTNLANENLGVQSISLVKTEDTKTEKKEDSSSYSKNIENKDDQIKLPKEDSQTITLTDDSNRPIESSTQKPKGGTIENINDDSKQTITEKEKESVEDLNKNENNQAESKIESPNEKIESNSKVVKDKKDEDNSKKDEMKKEQSTADKKGSLEMNEEKQNMVAAGESPSKSDKSFKIESSTTPKINKDTKNKAKTDKEKPKRDKVEDSLINEKINNEDSIIKFDGSTDEPIILSGKENIPVTIEIGGSNSNVKKQLKTSDDEKKIKKKPKTENVKPIQPIIPPEEKEEPTSSFSKQKPLSPENNIKNFRSVKISEIKPKKMWIPIPNSNGGHRRVPSVAITAGKDHKSSVKMWLYEEFFTQEECENLIKVHDEHVNVLSSRTPIICFDSIKTLRKSLNALGKSEMAENVTPNDFIEGTRCINQSLSGNLKEWGLKWSYNTAFYYGESRFSKIFSRRIEEATMLNETHGGKFQMTSYPYQVGFKSHTDCSTDTIDERDRYATFSMFLNDFIGDEGAETNFTILGIDVKPKTGRALTWNNMNYASGKCEAASAYEMNKVNTKNKKTYVITRWYYYKNFYSLGKRITEPEIPKREEGTPLVSCDMTDDGNCRLYDEWSYEHLLDYANRKQALKF